MNADQAAAKDSDQCEMIENLPFTTDSGIGARARIGLVVLATDYTVEHEFRKIFTIPGVDYFEARIKNSPSITPESLAAMGPLITDSVDLILPGDTLDVVAFGCTSASMVMGAEMITERIHAARPDAKATNPISAAFDAFDAFDAKRIAVLTPYREDVNLIVRKYIEQGGYNVPVFGSFNEENDPTVAAIDSKSLRDAIRAITKDRDVDCVFVSCTSVRLVDAVAEIEADVGLPVTSSNHAMAWHCLRLAGVPEKLDGLGRLFQLQL